MPPEDGLPCYLQFQYWDKTNAEYKAIADAWIKYYQKCIRNNYNDPRIFSNYGLLLKNFGKFFQEKTLIHTF